MKKQTMKGLGLGISSISQVYSLASKCWADFGDEIIPWLKTDAGKKEAEDALCLLRDRYIMTQEHLIDCEANPILPEGWTIIRHYKFGIVKWNIDNVSLYVVPKLQEKRNKIRGYDIRDATEGRFALNINAMKYLLRRQCLIPENWRDKAIVFWGTIARDHKRFPQVFYMYWDTESKRWKRSFAWVGAEFDKDNPAILLKVA